MEPAMIEHFRKIFLQILKEQNIFEKNLYPLFSGGDELDNVSVEKENQLDLRLKARNALYLKKVRKALQKIEEGTFGECTSCGDEISRQRLFARPTADLCILCKEEEEREEHQLMNKNRASLKNQSSLPIDQVQRSLKQDENGTSLFILNHYSYQDVVS